MTVIFYKPWPGGIYKPVGSCLDSEFDEFRADQQATLVRSIVRGHISHDATVFASMPARDAQLDAWIARAQRDDETPAMWEVHYLRTEVLGLNVAELARRLGVGPSVVHRWEDGQSGITADNLARLRRLAFDTMKARGARACAG